METSSILHDEWIDNTIAKNTKLKYSEWLEEKLKRHRKNTALDKETILEMLKGFKETVADMRGGPFIAITIVATANEEPPIMSPFGPMETGAEDTNDRLKKAAKAADETPPEEFTFLKENQKRIIKKGNISTAWRRGSLCVIMCGIEKLLINETLANFCKRMNWELD